MSYDIYLQGKNGATLELDEIHGIDGATRVMGGTPECWLNVTYNYAMHYRRVFGNDQGIRTIYGLTGAESIPVLKAAISKLGDDRSSNYWDATEGNAKTALEGLLAFAKERPDGVWAGD